MIVRLAPVALAIPLIYLFSIFLLPRIFRARKLPYFLSYGKIENNFQKFKTFLETVPSEEERNQMSKLYLSGYTNIAMMRLVIKSKGHWDEGIDRVTASDYWDKLRDSMAEQFQAGHFADGLLELLARVEEVLILNFPYQEGDVNELSDEISYHISKPNPLPWLIVGGILLSPLFNLFTALALRRSGLEFLMRRNKFAALINLAAWVTGVLCYLACYLFYRSWS